MNDDAQLLRRFAKEGCEPAFSQLVARHLNAVDSAALRQVAGDAPLTEDVTQTVFTELARQARSLPPGVVLGGWLHQVARRAAARAVRSERNRQAREREVLTMHDPTSESPSVWDQLCPLLDAAIGELNAKDRDVVVLRYFEGKNLRAVGAALGISEDTAQKRVARAVEKLHVILTRRGVTVTASALAVLLTTSTVHSAPAGMALSVTTASLAGASAATHGMFITCLMQGLATTTSKVVGTAAVVFLLGAWVTAVLCSPSSDQGRFSTVDLLRYYNGGLKTFWLPSGEPGNNLAGLPHGRRVFANIPFDVRGLVHLQGREWEKLGYRLPERVAGIQIGSAFQRLHLLHANSAFRDPDGTPVARLVLHYADGQQAEFEIRQGEHTLDYWAWRDTPTDRNTVVAWTGENPAVAKKGIKLRILKTMFWNPQPTNKVETIDYVSDMAGSAPFMVALTLER